MNILWEDKLDFLFVLPSGGRILLKGQTWGDTVYSNKLEVFILTLLSLSTVSVDARKAAPPKTHMRTVVKRANSKLMALPYFFPLY